MIRDNYCTFFREGSWSHCCEAHDVAYETQVDKKQADIDLYSCVKGSSPEALTWIVADLMLAGVSLFGSRFYKEK